MSEEQMTADEYRAMLKGHDWYYTYSDDGRVYAKGKKSEDAVRAATKKLDEAGRGEEAEAIWSECAPKGFDYPGKK